MTSSSGVSSGTSGAGRLPLAVRPVAVGGRRGQQVAPVLGPQPHLNRPALQVPHRGLVPPDAPQDVVKRLHDRRPLVPAARGAKLDAVADALGRAAVPLLPPALPVATLPRGPDPLLERGLADPERLGDLGGHRHRRVELVLREVGGQGRRLQRVPDLAGRRGPDPLPDRAEVEAQLIGRAPVREAVDPDRAVAAAHDPRLAPAVRDALDGIGQRLADEPLRLGQHVAHRLARQPRVVELERDPGAQHPFALPRDRLAGLALADVEAPRHRGGARRDEAPAQLHSPLRQPVARHGDQVFVFRGLGRVERRARGARVERGADANPRRARRAVL